jgi:SAM-dependent methyltransferase
LDENERTAENERMSQAWSPTDYRQHAGFVPALGATILSKLAAQPGERILDLGCGDGVLTRQIAAAGAIVVGVDSSPEMVAAAVAAGLEAHVADARHLTYGAEFDAVFSNAVLHWIHDADAVLSGVARALKPGGRFVAELGGHGNIAAIAVALRAVFNAHGIEVPWPWYYPTPDEYAARLEAAGLVPQQIALVPRPTPLPTDMDGWLRTFAGSFFSAVPEDQRQAIAAEIVELLRPSLADSGGRWTADYVRLQVIAIKP